MQHVRFVVGVISLAVITSLSGLLLASTILPWGAGWNRVVLTSGSMSPGILPGDIVLARTDVQHPVEPGAVLVFENPNKPGGLVTHRVVENLAGGYRTQGDANTDPDTAELPYDAVVGQATLLVPKVGLPSVWIQQGQGELAVLVLGSVILLGALSRYGILEKYDPWVVAETEELNSTSGKTKLVSAATAASVLTAVLIAPAAFPATQFSQAAYTATARNLQNTVATAAATGSTFFLKTSGTGDEALPPLMLPLAVTPPTRTTLYNYDRDRDNNPGLTLQQSSFGLNETEAKLVQRWNIQASSALVLSGNVRVTLWSAIKQFNTSRAGSVTVGLYDCIDQSSCTQLAAGTVASTGSWSGGSNTWVSKDWDLGPVNRTVAAGRFLQLRVVVNRDEIMFAYDTTAHPSRITIGG